LAGQFFDALSHNLAGLKFHGRARWNDETATRLIWVSSHPRLGQSRLENSKVAQFDRNVVGQTVSNFVEGTLDNVEDLVLHHSGLVANRNHDVAFRKLCHTSKECIVCQGTIAGTIGEEK